MRPFRSPKFDRWPLQVQTSSPAARAFESTASAARITGASTIFPSTAKAPNPAASFAAAALTICRARAIASADGVNAD